MNGSRIKVLPEDLINKIAAGEVIERPASVVKELIENSIDAGSTRAMIEIHNAGTRIIRVSDNGCGMSKEEIQISIERHSTSKITKLDDLFNINTLGFRGEALPSIASVSRFEIRSMIKGGEAGLDVGSQLKVEGGKLKDIEDAALPQGTTVIIKDLFFNTPARRKFLKSDATELGHIGDIVSKYVMAYPQIAFELISDGKQLISSSGIGKLKDAIAAVYGVDIAKDLIEVNFEFQSIKVSGFISSPTTSRIDRNYENFFVNRRYVHNFLLNRALENAYRTLIPLNRYPIAILFVDIDPKQIDVNVHPTKKEVKFSNNYEVMNAIAAATKEALSAVIDNKISPVISQPGVVWENDQLPITNFESGIEVLSPTNIELNITAIQPLIPIYQFKNTYIISTDGDDLVIIDQHAAHERILYDRLSGKSSPEHSQPLLILETIDLNPKESAILNENMDYLKGLGFDLEEFGNNSYILRSVPYVAVKSNAKLMVLDIISELQNIGKTIQLDAKQESIRKLVACRSAIKAGDKLKIDEMNQLIKDLYATQNPTTCPHGRPTMIRLTESEFMKKFGR